VIAAGGNLFDLVVTPGYWGLSSSDYHALQAKFERRFTKGFSVLANFTWSSCMATRINREVPLPIKLP